MLSQHSTAASSLADCQAKEWHIVHQLLPSMARHWCRDSLAGAHLIGVSMCGRQLVNVHLTQCHGKRVIASQQHMGILCNQYISA